MDLTDGEIQMLTYARELLSDPERFSIGAMCRDRRRRPTFLWSQGVTEPVRFCFYGAIAYAALELSLPGKKCLTEKLDDYIRDHYSTDPNTPFRPMAHFSDRQGREEVLELIDEVLGR